MGISTLINGYTVHMSGEDALLFRFQPLPGALLNHVNPTTFKKMTIVDILDFLERWYLWSTGDPVRKSENALRIGILSTGCLEDCRLRLTTDTDIVYRCAR